MKFTLEKRCMFNTQLLLTFKELEDLGNIPAGQIKAYQYFPTTIRFNFSKIDVLEAEGRVIKFRRKIEEIIPPETECEVIFSTNT